MQLFTRIYLLAFGICLLLRPISADACVNPFTFQTVLMNSVPVEAPSAMKKDVTQIECSHLCFKLYSYDCKAFFYDTLAKSCFIYSSSVHCMTLRAAPGTKAFVYTTNESETVPMCWPTTAGLHPLDFPDLPTIRGYFDIDQWLIIHNRNENDMGFNRTWEEYKDGFGNTVDEFWLGNKYIHALTSQTNYQVQFDLTSRNGELGMIRYNQFRISNLVDRYRLTIGNTTASTILSDRMCVHNNKRFSTKDEDNDGSTDNCALQKGGGWWYDNCGPVSLNTEYEPSYWMPFTDDLKLSKIKIKPVNL